MRTTCRWTYVRHSVVLAASAIVVLVSPSGLAAQERPPGLLNKLDVRALVARGDPVDHDRLFVHFRVLWNSYLTEAKHHDSMTHSVIGNPNRPSGVGTTEHCKQLATLDRRSAKTVRELALYYKQLAEGAPATLPPGAARFQGGAGAPDPTEQELVVLAKQAHTRTDHLALEEYLRMVAARHLRTANEHSMQALTFRGGRFAQAAAHQEQLASVARRAATEATRVADLHKQLATILL